LSDKKDMHRKYAVDCFNGTWDLLDKTDRTSDEAQRMIHMTHASRFHWGEIGTPLNFARGDWQISRVYAVLGDSSNALKYGQSCLEICQAEGIGDFDRAFAYEAIARAYAVAGDDANKEKYLAFAKDSGSEIEKDEDKVYFFNELGTIN